MSAVEEFESLIEQIQSYGVKVRYDYFGGTGGGICQFGGGQWYFVDLALSVTERLDQLKSHLESDSRLSSLLQRLPRAA